MGKEANKGQGQNRFKKEYNNYNPYNKLDLNRFHQVKEQNTNHNHGLLKKKRDIERMIEYRKKKGLQVHEEKLQELGNVEQKLGDKRKTYEKQKRKEFFLSSQYKQIMNIEKRKVAKKLREIKQEHPIDQTLQGEWFKKLNYIKHFPKNLKYISLFPKGELSPKALQFQQKIINDIEQSLAKKEQKLNHFEAEYKVNNKKLRPSKRDDFFLEEEEDEAGKQVQDQQNQALEQEQNENEGQQVESQQQ